MNQTELLQRSPHGFLAVFVGVCAEDSSLDEAGGTPLGGTPALIRFVAGPSMMRNLVRRFARRVGERPTAGAAKRSSATCARTVLKSSRSHTVR